MLTWKGIGQHVTLDLECGKVGIIQNKIEDISGDLLVGCHISKQSRFLLKISRKEDFMFKNTQ